MPEEIPEPEEITEEEYQKLLERIRPKRPPKPLRELQPKAATPLPGITPPLPLPEMLARQIKKIPAGKRPGHLSGGSKATTEAEKAVVAASKDARVPVTCPKCGAKFEASGPFPKTVTCPECGWSGEIKI